MNTYLVIPRSQAANALDWAYAQVVTAPDEDRAAANAYRRCIVIACDVFDGDPPVEQAAA